MSMLILFVIKRPEQVGAVEEKTIQIIRNGVAIGHVTVQIRNKYVFVYNKTDRDLFITVTVTYKWDDGIWRVRFGGILSAGEGKELEGEIRGNTRVKILKIETEDAAVRGKD